MAKLDFDSSIAFLLKKGFDSHGHFEGAPVDEAIRQILLEVAELYDHDNKLAERFKTLTGKTHHQVLEDLEYISALSEQPARQMDFAKDFLPSLFLMKLAEASNPEYIYKVTKAQLEYDLRVNGGFSREINPTVWLEMGFDYDASCNAFVKGVEAALENAIIRGNIEIGVSVKRKFVQRFPDKNKDPLISNVEDVYLKCTDLVEKLKMSKVGDKVKIFINTIDLARSDPLFSFKGNDERGEYTKRLYSKAEELGVYSYVHLLEELANPELLLEGQEREYELEFILDLFEELGIKNPRFIHMAYWPKANRLPFLERMKQINSEIAICQSSTRSLGVTHNPPSPFLLQSKEVVEGAIYDQDFPKLMLGSDDMGPFKVKNIWEEYATVYKDVNEWHGSENADLLLIQLLRDSYNGLSSAQIEQQFGLNKMAVDFVFAYDIYKEKHQLRSKPVTEAVRERVADILEKQKELK
ncbi:MAG: hypothetical protein Fur003_5280 [Candidatus Dojkabacteria bacterium]